MKTRESLLSDFINDFNLEAAQDDAVCFDASIEFRAKGVYKKMNSEVHIITLKMTGLSVVYLLHPDIARHHIPETIPFSADHFTYLQHAALMIVDHSPLFGKYLITITPLSNACEPQTIAELRAKKFN